jgi:hypothetical protein
MILVPLALSAWGCGSSGKGGEAEVAPDALAEAAPEAIEAAEESTPAPECKDSRVLKSFVAGAWVEHDCWVAERGLCQDGACVQPWAYGSPQWPTCAEETRGTTETLAQKAAFYDELATRLHLHPLLKWAMGVTLKPGVSEDDATWQDVAQWHSGENDGLWSGLYLASQAFRYAALPVEERAPVLATIKTLVEGEVTRMAITGVPGIFTRQFIPPGIDGIACPSDPAEYIPDIEKDDNPWVQIREDGCVWVVDRDTLQWKGTDHCGLAAYAGWCFKDNVSQDEYAGHMLALAALYKLVDDPQVHAAATDMITQVAVHLMEHNLTLVDWDGRVTEHGKFYVTSFADTPGFLVAEVLGFLRMGITASGRQDLIDFLDNCVMQKTSMGKCLPWPLEKGTPYQDLLDQQLHYLGVGPGCGANYNNFSMVMTYFVDLLWFERDLETLELAWEAFDTQLMRFDSPRALIHQGNAWFNFMWAAMKKLGPGSDGPDLGAVNSAICSLKQYPARKHQVTRDPGAKYPHFCDGRFDKDPTDDEHLDSKTELPVPVADRCVKNFLWWGDPYDRDGCSENLSDVSQPGDYLLAYWMGRYFGFIPADL